MRLRAGRRLPEAVVFAVALAVRIGVVASSPAGFNGAYGYDQSVYYSASVSLLHGRVPYHDFVLLHPPMIMLALLPAALLGHWTTDHAGFVAANLGFGAVGALNAALVVVLARRLGLRTSAATAGGLLYATWLVTVNAEYSARLEPLANLFFLLALLALVAAVERSGSSRARWLAASGALFGAATSVKIWFLVPLAVALGWLVVRERRAIPALWLLSGSVAAVVLIDVPFLIASRGEMWTMVVRAQLGRSNTTDPFVERLSELTAAYWPQLDPHSPGTAVVTALGAVLLLAILGLAWRVAAARFVLCTAVACLITLWLTPTWFARYADFAAVPIAVAAAAAAESLPTRVRVLGWLPGAVTSCVMLAVLVQNNVAVTTYWGPPPMAVAARQVRCVTSDTPEGLIALDVLDRSLTNGCDVRVDTIGLALLEPGSKSLRLARDLHWQRDMLAYLESGQLTYPYLARGTYAPEVRRQLSSLRTVLAIRAAGRRFVLYEAGNVTGPAARGNPRPPG